MKEIEYTSPGQTIKVSSTGPIEINAATEYIHTPKHYLSGSIECIDAMEEMLEPEEFAGYLRGNVFKYLWRCMYKGETIKDLEKAQWYLNKLIGTLNDG